MRCPICGADAEVAPVTRGFGEQWFFAECSACYITFYVKISSVAPRSGIPELAYRQGLIQDLTAEQKEIADKVYGRGAKNGISIMKLDRIRRKLVNAYILSQSKLHRVYLAGMESAQKQMESAQSAQKQEGGE